MLSDSPCPKCGFVGFCKHKQLSGKRSGIGQKNKADDVSLIKKDIKHAKERSKAQERFIAEEYKDSGFEKARRVPGSGAFHDAMLYADVDPGEMYLIEAKQTRSGKLVIEPAWIKKVREEAASLGRRYLLHGWVAEGEDQYTKVVVMDESAWFDIVKKLKEKDNESEGNG